MRIERHEGSNKNRVAPELIPATNSQDHETTTSNNNSSTGCVNRLQNNTRSASEKWIRDFNNTDMQFPIN